MTEDQLEQEALGWLADVGYSLVYGPDMAPDGPAPERNNYRQVILTGRLRTAIDRLNPGVPAAARDDALKQLMDLGITGMLAANRRFHQLMVTGVPVQYQRDGETRGDFVRLIDWTTTAANEWLAVNQFSIKGPHHTRRPDIILFVNGLPLVLLELKNPADQQADVWKAYDQIQTYKEQIPDVFQYNEILVISDGTEALLGSLSATGERFMAWRTIDGITLDPLGEFNELQTLVRGGCPSNRNTSIHLQAEAMAAYARQAKDTELVQWATEIKVRAERKAGELLRLSAMRGDRHPAGGPRSKQAESHAGIRPSTLEEIGITNTQSSRWQPLAGMTDEHFETAVETAKDTAGQVTTAFMLREAVALRT